MTEAQARRSLGINRVEQHGLGLFFLRFPSAFLRSICATPCAARGRAGNSSDSFSKENRKRQSRLVGASMKTLFLQAPSFDGFDGGAGSRYQNKREVRSFWYPTWLAQPAALIADSRVLD